MPSILTVVGATGTQGGSVVDAALASGTYQVRAVTRDIQSDKAQALTARGVQVVAADLNDEQSLVKAFHGSIAIFAVTDFFEPFAAGGPEAAMRTEITQGKNLAKAAAKTSTLKHYIWSTLPNVMKISSGKYLVPHFEAKNKIDNYIKEDASLYAKTTFLWVTFYPSNYLFPMFTPNIMKTSGKYVQLQVAAPTTPILTIGDVRKNVGAFAVSILSQPQITLGGKVVLAFAEKTTTGDLLNTWGRVTGKSVAYVQTTSLVEYDNVWPMWGHEMGIMMQFWDQFKDESWSGEQVLTKDDLNIQGRLIGAEEAFRNMDWSAF